VNFGNVKWIFAKRKYIGRAGHRWCALCAGFLFCVGPNRGDQPPIWDRTRCSLSCECLRRRCLGSADHPVRTPRRLDSRDDCRQNPTALPLCLAELPQIYAMFARRSSCDSIVFSSVVCPWSRLCSHRSTIAAHSPRTSRAPSRATLRRLSPGAAPIGGAASLAGLTACAGN